MLGRQVRQGERLMSTTAEPTRDPVPAEVVDELAELGLEIVTAGARPRSWKTPDCSVYCADCRRKRGYGQRETMPALLERTRCWCGSTTVEFRDYDGGQPFAPLSIIVTEAKTSGYPDTKEQDR
jgi:hypothetical protein